MKTTLAALLFSACALARAGDWHDSAAVATLFREAGVSGTFVLHDVAADRYTVHDRARADTRYVPASTFKIPNSLIGLASGAVASVDDVLPYGGKPQPFPFWEKDMGLRDAIKVSNVPVYQELARRIGMERMRDGLRRLGYGNMDAGAVVDTFWLTGPLAISAVEQTAFLGKLAQDRLPFPPDAMASVREIALLDSGDGYRLYGKTGWSGVHETADGKRVAIGWWVGWVERGGKLYTFALNIDILGEEAGAKRVPLGKASLKALGVLP